MNVSVKSNLTGKQKKKGRFHIVYFEEVLGALRTALLLSALTHFPL